MMDRTEAPTASRIAELRTRGIVPQSRLFTRIAELGGAMLGAGISVDPLRESVRMLTDSSRSGSASDVLAALEPLSLGAVRFALPVLAFGMIAQLLQTRFLFRPSLAGPSLSKLLRTGVYRRGGGMSGVVGGLFVIPIASLASVGLGLVSIREAAVVAAAPADAVPWYLARFSERILPLAIGATLLAGVLSYLGAQVGFRLRHRMTRQQVLKERTAG